ncbi:SEA (Seh1-associated) complex subunit [Dispira simplex]|nr:SEA (Seh1-associated) complex subunit [Dispira simplex]
MTLPVIPKDLTDQYKNAFFLYARNVPGNLSTEDIIRYFRRKCFQVYVEPPEQDNTKSSDNNSSKRSARATSNVWLICSKKAEALDIRVNFGYKRWGGDLLEISGPFPGRRKSTVLTLGFSPPRRDPAYVFRLQLADITRVFHLDLLPSEKYGMSVMYLYYDDYENAARDLRTIQTKCSHRKDFVVCKGRSSRRDMKEAMDKLRKSTPSSARQSHTNSIVLSGDQANTGGITGPPPARSTKFTSGSQANGKHSMKSSEPPSVKRPIHDTANSQGPSKRARVTPPANQIQAKVNYVSDKWRPPRVPPHPPETPPNVNKGTLISVPTNVKVGLHTFVVHAGKSDTGSGVNKSVPAVSANLHVNSALKPPHTTSHHPPKLALKPPPTKSKNPGEHVLPARSSSSGPAHRSTAATPSSLTKAPPTSVTSPTPSTSSRAVTPVGNTVLHPMQTRSCTGTTLESSKSATSTVPSHSTKASFTSSSAETYGKVHTMPMVYETWSIYTSNLTKGSPPISSIFVNGVQHNRSLLSLPSSLDVVSVLNSGWLGNSSTNATLERYSISFFPCITNPHLRTVSSLDIPAQPEISTLRTQVTRNLMRKGTGLLRASDGSDFKFLTGSPNFIMGFNNAFLDHSPGAKTLSLRPRVSQGVSLGLPLDVQGSTVVGYDTGHRCLMWWDVRNIPTTSTTPADAHIPIEATHTSPTSSIQITSVAIRPQDGGVLIGHGVDLSLWDLREPEIVSLERWAHTDPITAMTCNPYRDYQVLTGDAGGTIRLWDIRQMKRNYDEVISSPLFISKLHSDSITRLQWSKGNADVFGSSGQDGLVALWNPRAEESKGALFYHRGHRGPVRDFSFVDKDFLVISAGHYQRQGKLVNEVQMWRPNPWLMDLNDV